MRTRTFIHSPLRARFSRPPVAILLLAIAISMAGATTPVFPARQAASRAVLAASITRGPYLQMGQPDGITVRWRTNSNTNSRVQYGTTPQNLNHHVDNSNQTTEHEIALTGLSSNTLYYYSVGSSSEVLASGADYYFRTSPPAGTASPTRIWILGDSGETGQGAIDVRDAYYDYPGSADTDFWIMLGDNAYDTGNDSEYQSVLFNRYNTFLRHCPLWSTRGNHEDLFSGANNDYYDFFNMPTGGQIGGVPSGSEAYYSFEYGNIHFICLDSEGSNRSTSGPMLTWLELDLDANTRPWIIAFWHHPPYSKGSHDSDDGGDSDGRLRDMRQNALPILEQGGVDLVLSGHSHSYERSMLIDGHYGTSNTFNSSMIEDGGDGDPSGDGAYEKPNSVNAAHQGAVYTVAGSSSEIDGGDLDHPVMVTSLNVMGSMVIDVSGPLLNAVFLDKNGVIRDHFQISKGSAGTDTAQPIHSVAALSLAAPAPNPFSSQTSFHFSLPAAGHVRMAVFDVSGRRMTTLVDGRKEEGRHHVEWNGKDSAGNRIPAGTYFVQLEANGEQRTQKVVLMDAARS
ncbi:MAG TPA: metallophosphoesterase [bacterium]|nr:metallophosphoesterase [bacterium]